MNFELNNRIKMLNKYANVDALYGPYNSTAAACEAIPTSLRSQGLTVGIINQVGRVEEYWWNTEDTSDSALRVKLEEVNLVIDIVGDSVLDVEEGGNVVLRFSVEGRAAIQKGMLYRVVGGSEIFQSEFTNFGKGAGNSITIPSPAQSGVYTYRIKVLDSTGAYAKNIDDEDNIEYTVRYGGISANYSFTQLNYIQIKNTTTVAGKYFTGDISVRDETFEVLGVYLSDGDNINIPLTPRESLADPTPTTYIGFRYYIIPDKTTIDGLNGKACYIRLSYTENGVNKIKDTEVFVLLDTSSLSVVSQTAQRKYYKNHASYYTFQLQSGVQNLSVYVRQPANETEGPSDFTFDAVTVSSYNSYSLRIIPTNITNAAKITLVCQYSVSNVSYVETFTMTIGSIEEVVYGQLYDPTGSNVYYRKDVVLADENDIEFNEDGISGYYKVFNTPDTSAGETTFVSDDIQTNAFLVDLSCKINQVNNSNINYIRIYQGSVEIGRITEDIISGRDIITDTPLNEWVQIGISYNMQETTNRGGSEITGAYHAIYINGMVVKTVQLDGNNELPDQIGGVAQPIRIEISGGIYVQRCFVYYASGQNRFGDTAGINSIIYNNYTANISDYSEPEGLPVLKLNRIIDAQDKEKYFAAISAKNEYIRYLTTFGTIGLEKAGSMSAYDEHYDDPSYGINRDYATLFRQNVQIKKPAQKEYGVLCTGNWMVNGQNLLADYVIEVHTQGTSTLNYSVPNFKFTFWEMSGSGDSIVANKAYPNFIVKSDDGEGNVDYYHESVYTAKADYMDSSHLNNTPTCTFFNQLVQNLIADTTSETFASFTGSPSAATGNLDAIVGFPIVLQINDSGSEDYLNIGSFMLNIDKTGESLGFQVSIPVDGEDTTIDLECLSFEGTSNDNESGHAGRFIIPDGANLYDFEDNSEIDSYADEAAAALAASGKKLSVNATVGNYTASNHPYIKWCKFLSDGLEYRYPDNDIYKESNGFISKLMKKAEFKKLYRMWIWVSRSDRVGDLNFNYVNEFPDYFNVDYCILYFIQLMVFGQTDNLGKNAMFDTWDGLHWYPRPYDLDSEAGLDNNGNDNVAPFVEIKPEFSRNYDPNYTLEELTENFLLPNSTIYYAGQNLDRYHYSSNTSKLWINFYINFRSRIESFYYQLRTIGGYTPDAIINFCENQVIKKLGVAQYNQDFQNKYLATNLQWMAYGNRWYKFQKWIRQRFAFCDSYFNAAQNTTYALTSTITYSLKLASPQYVIQDYQGQSIVKFAAPSATSTANQVSLSTGSGAATQFHLVVNQDQVLETSLFKYVTKISGPSQYYNIIKADASYNRQISNVTTLTGTTLNNLKEMDVTGSSVSTINNLPQQLQKLIADNVSLTSISIPEECEVSTISLKNSTVNSTIELRNLPHLKKLDLTNCKVNGTIILDRLPTLEQLIITDAVFNGTIVIQNGVNIDTFNLSGLTVYGISFDGNDVRVKNLNFTDTTFSQDTINFDAICDTLENVYFARCINLKHIQLTSGKKLTKLVRFGIANSPITSLGADNTKFDMSYIQTIANLRKADGSAFTFANTNIQEVTNLTWAGTGERLFQNCKYLTTISNSILSLTSSIDYMFDMCAALTALPSNITVNNSVVTARYAFAGTTALSYSDIASMIKKCKKVTTFYRAVFCKALSQNTIVDLIDILGENTATTLSLSEMFGGWSASVTGYTTIRNTIKIKGYIGQNVTSVSRMFTYTNAQVPYNIFSSSDVNTAASGQTPVRSSLTSMSGVFYNSNITFVDSGELVVTKPNESVSLPAYEYQQEVYYLTDTVDKNFFPHTVTNLSFAFQNSNIQTNDSTAFANLTGLTTAQCCFYNSHSGKFQTTIASTTIALDLDVSDLWATCTNISNIAGCFSGIKNVYVNGTINLSSSMTPAETLNISNLFGLSSAAADSKVITINLSAISPKLVTNSYHSTISGSTYYLGVFQNRTVILSDTDQDEHEQSDTTRSILSKLQGGCRNLFYNTKLFIDNSINTFDLSNVTDAYNMFAYCKLYVNNGDMVTPTRRFVNVKMPTSCAYYQYMFYKSYMLNNLPSIRSAAAKNFNYAFCGCAIVDSNTVIPANYFQICKSNLTDVRYMFADNMYIYKLGYDDEVGLLQNCVLLENVSHMFDGTYFLHGGIPNNLFGKTIASTVAYDLEKLTSLEYMFANSSVFYGCVDDLDGLTKMWVDSSTFAPLTRLSTIEGMFSGVRINQTYGETGFTYKKTITVNVDGTNEQHDIIDGNTFAGKYVQTIRNLFYRSSILSSISFAFYGFAYGDRAFCDADISTINSTFIANSDNLSAIKNVSYMFAETTGGTHTISNLYLFVDNLLDLSPRPIMTKIAGNITDSNIPSAYTDNYQQDLFSGHNLSRTIYSNT